MIPIDEDLIVGGEYVYDSSNIFYVLAEWNKVTGYAALKNADGYVWKTRESYIRKYMHFRPGGYNESPNRKSPWRY